MTIHDFLAVDSLTLARLTDAQLREIATGGRKIANQRISRLKAAEMTNSPAFQALPAKVKSAGFKTAKLSRTALLHQIELQQQFVRGRTSTVTGWRAVQTKAYERTAEESGKFRKIRYGYDDHGQLVILKPGEKSALTRKQMDTFWDLFHKLDQDKERVGAVGSQEYKYRAIYQTIKKHPRTSAKNLETAVQEELQAEYEADQDQKRKQEEKIKSAGGTKL